MPFNLFLFLALGGFAVGNLFWQGYMALWVITIVPVAIATILRTLTNLKARKTEMKASSVYVLTVMATVNFTASAGFFLSFGLYWYALFMAAFAVYWGISATRVSRRMTHLTDDTPTPL